MKEKTMTGAVRGTNTTAKVYMPKTNRQIFLHKIRQPLFWRKVLAAIFFVALFSGLVYVLLYPIIYIFTNSLKSSTDMLDATTIWIAKNPKLIENYQRTFEAMDYLTGLKNTLLVALPNMIMQIMMCSVIGYGLARFKFRERGLIFGLVILTLIIPDQTISIPQFLAYKDFDFLGIVRALTGQTINLFGTHVPLILPSFFGLGIKSGLFIYLFRQFYRGMPKELEEAGYIDGCGPLKTYLRIMLPNAVPAIVTVGLLSFVWNWCDVYGAQLYLNKTELMPLSTRLISVLYLITKNPAAGIAQSYTLPLKYAGCAMFILPLFIIYLVGQRYFVESMERSGIVG